MRDFDLIGIGSSVLDTLYQVDSILKPESKGFIRSRREMLGGVTLNHLCWGSFLGLKTALIGVGAEDAAGAFLRSGLDGYGVDHSGFLRHGSHTAHCHIFIDPKGERVIYMDPGPTGSLRAGDIARFLPWIRRARALSTEISQLRLATVCKALEAAKKAGCRTFLDLDIPPSQATGSARLGNAVELKKALALADDIKTSLDAASELVASQSPEKMAAALHRKLGKKAGHWVALTAGSKGSAISDGRRSLFIPSVKGLKVVDTTGAGDAYLGGLIAGTLAGADLPRLGRLATTTAAACVVRLGAVPPAKTGSPGGHPGMEFVRKALKELAGVEGRFSTGGLDRAADLILSSEKKGRNLHVTGVGKPEHVARYVASSFSSTGTPCTFLHGTEALHGSAGQVRAGDLVIVISDSGETREIKDAVVTLVKNGARILAVTGHPGSWLARHAESVLETGVKAEGDRLGLAPRASTLAQMLVLSSLGVLLQERKDFKAADFRRRHPYGALGR